MHATAGRLGASSFASLLLVASSALAQAAADGPNSLDEANQVPIVGSAQPRLLEEALERYRDIEARGGWKPVPTDLVMGEGYEYECSRITALERRLVVEGYLDRVSSPPPPPPGVQPASAPERSRKAQKNLPPPQPPTCLYSKRLAQAVLAFQSDRKVLGVGQLGRQTMVELNRPVGEIVDILEHDVARWRGVHLSPSGTFLMANIPFFELSVFEENDEVMRMPVVVGQKTWPTPLFSDQIEYMILNPDWGIPDKIAKLEYLPTARRNPKWLAAQGISNDGGSLRQKPGPRNPLGRVKFVMPNEHDVYLHDTPEKRAFQAVVRALSHGCVRLGRPVDLAAYLLREEPSWDRRSLESAISSGRTRQINLRRPMPVHIVYSTSRVNEKGRLELRPDVYGKNRGRSRREEAAPGRGDESLESWP